MFPLCNINHSKITDYHNIISLQLTLRFVKHNTALNEIKQIVSNLIWNSCRM